MATPYMRKVEYILYNEDEVRELVYEARAKVALSEIRNGSSQSDPTAAAAIRNMTPILTVVIGNQLLRRPEEWLEVAELTRRWCAEQGAEYLRIMRGKYKRESASAICTELNISGDYYREVVKKIRRYAAMWAAWYHLIEF